jgi:hypothetical protein
VLAGVGDAMWHPGDGAAENPDAAVPGVLANLMPDDAPTDDETLGAGMEPQQPDSSTSWEERNETLQNATGSDDTTVDDTQNNPIYHDDDPAIENPDAAVPDVGDNLSDSGSDDDDDDSSSSGSSYEPDPDPDPIYHDDDPDVENPDSAVDLDSPDDWDFGA